MRLAFYIPLASDRRTMRRLKTGLIMARLLIAYIVLALLKHLVPLTWLVRWVWYPPVGPRDCEAEWRLTSIVLRLSRLTGLPEAIAFDADYCSIVCCRMWALSRHSSLGSRQTAASAVRLGSPSTARAVVEPEAELVGFLQLYGFTLWFAR